MLFPLNLHRFSYRLHFAANRTRFGCIARHHAGLALRRSGRFHRPLSEVRKSVVIVVALGIP
jgi:hypothetical protein